MSSSIEKEFDLGNYFPRDVSYSQEKRIIYENLKNESISPLRDKTMADIFVYAVIFGYKKPNKVPLEKPVPQIPSNAFSDTNKSLMLAIAVSSSPKGVDILLEKEEVRRDLEQYANGGIEILEKYLTEGKVGDSLSNLEAKMRELLVEESTIQSTRETKLEEIERTPEAIKQISLLETNLRYLIPKVLATKTERWEDSLPDKTILKKWKNEKEKNEKALKQYDRAGTFEPIDFSHLGELEPIIINKNLWPLFEPIFGNIEIFKSNMMEVMMNRNDPAHGRGLTETQAGVVVSICNRRNKEIDKALEKL